MKLINHAQIAAVFMLFITLFSFVTYTSEAIPQGPNTLNISGSGRNPANTEPIAVTAKAGNITALVIDGTRVTESWQGYYGNITGTITLDDSNNFTMYDWSLPNPQGEVYASNHSSVTWESVYCMNLSHKRPLGGDSTTASGSIYYNINMTQIELNYGINLTDKDGLNETFNDTYTDPTGFRVGSVTIDYEDGCSMTHPYLTQLYNTAWQELLLTDNTSLIFTAIIRDNADGFQDGSNDIMDFQLMVLENGHYGSEDAVSTYYFFVELS